MIENTTKLTIPPTPASVTTSESSSPPPAAATVESIAPEIPETPETPEISGNSNNAENVEFSRILKTTKLPKTSSYGSEEFRRGKWTREEEEYARQLIGYFEAGLLPIEEGTSLRSLLSKLLKCDPMRITKKFTGLQSIGKREFTPAPVTEENIAFIKEAQMNLIQLRVNL